MNIENILKKFDNYERDITIQNFISQVNSRYILHNVKENEENFPQYSEELDEKCTSIAFNYLTYGYTFSINNMKDKGEYSLEKSAEILEHVFCFSECKHIYKKYYSIVCALSYYSSSQYSKAFIILQKQAVDTRLANLIKLFLIKDLHELERLIAEIQIDDNLYGKDMERDVVYEKILSLYFINIIQYIYLGNDKFLSKSNEIINDLIEIATINEEPHLWWVFRLLHLINKDYKYKSLWGTIRPLLGDNKIVKNYINANVYKDKAVSELFKSQRECLPKIELENGAIISLPTSSGKTKIAEIAILKSLIDNSNSICLYIAPFRSLAFEVEKSLSSTLGLIGYNVSNLYGSTQYTQIDKALIKEANVIIATPEKAKAIIRGTDGLLERLKLVIIDEGHLVGRKDRYIISELFIEELKIKLDRNNGKFILLSAVLPNLSDFSRWVTGDEDSIGLSNWRPSSQRIGVLNFNNNVDIKWLGSYESFNNRFIESILIKPKRITKTGKEYPAKYFPEDKKEAVGATAVKMLSLGSVLIYVGRSNMVNSQARVVYNIMQENRIKHTWENENDLELVRLSCEEAYGEESEIIKYVENGIICHSSKLPTDVRLSIEKLMANGTAKVIIATSTLAQGVNIGVSTTIISNVYLDEKNIVENKDFWNIAGRAGRAFVDTEGKILYAIDRSKSKDEWSINKQKKEMNNYLDKSKIEEATSGVYLLLRELYIISKKCKIDYEFFLELISENQAIINSNTITSKFSEFINREFDLIDDTLLALNMEYNSSEMVDKSAWVEMCFKNSLAYISAENDADFTKEKVIDMLKARNSAVLNMAGTYDNWSILANSSVPLRVSIAISEMLDDVISEVNSYINSDLSLINLIGYMDKIISKLPTRNTINCIEDKDIFEEIRLAWFEGVPFSEIGKMDINAQKLCSEYYGFHFPWIINTFSKIMKKLGYDAQSKIMENISLMAEAGLPNIGSIKVYLSGIKSREIALEIFNVLDLNEELNLENIKIRMQKVCDNIEKEKIKYSHKAIRWLSVLNLESREKSVKSIKKNKILIKKFKQEERIYVKNINNKFYLCSFDYSVKYEIKKQEVDIVKYIADVRGVWFEHESDGIWKMNSNNPYITLI